MFFNMLFVNKNFKHNGEKKIMLNYSKLRIGGLSCFISYSCYY